MRINSVKMSAALAILALALPSVGSAADNAANGEDIFKNGKGAAISCVTCHGEKGLGSDAMGTPRIAGQMKSFLIKQLTDFADNKRTDSTMFTMNGVASALSKQDRRDVAEYLSRRQDPIEPSDLNALKAAGTEVGETYLGKALVNAGNVERGIAACRACHGYNGRGVPKIYPTIGGQRYVYLVKQLKNWRDGSRTNDTMGQMRVVAKNMTDADIYNVAAYLTSAGPLSLGNTRQPDNH